MFLTVEMYTGAIEESGEVVKTTETDGGYRLRIRNETVAGVLTNGGSISVSGICLTAERMGDDWFEAFCTAETLERSYLGGLSVGNWVNLERPATPNAPLDGHIVKGTVDTTTEIVDVERRGEGWTFTFALPDGYEQYVIEKGSIAIDGISLTVSTLGSDSFTVAVIPETHERTTLSEKEPGDSVHIEVDELAKYAERQLAVKT